MKKLSFIAVLSMTLWTVSGASLAVDTRSTGNDDPEFLGKAIGEVLEIITDRMEKDNGDIKNVLEEDGNHAK